MYGGEQEIELLRLPSEDVSVLVMSDSTMFGP